MGNAAAKEALESAELGKCTLHEGGASSVDAGSVTTESPTKLKLKGSSFYYAGDGKRIMMKCKTEGMFGKRGSLVDGEGSVMAKIAIKSGLSADVVYVMREGKPAYEGQEPIKAEDLKRMKEPEGTELYAFAKCEAKMGLTTANATYSIVTGTDGSGESTFEPMYVAQKLSAVKFMALVKTAKDEVPVAKAMMRGGFSTSVDFEVSEGVDMAAMFVCMLGATPGGNAGALAGAGVI